MSPFVPTIIGLGDVYLGIVWQRHGMLISSRLRGVLPLPVRERVEKRH